jgi:hypothetical protein
MAYFMVYNRSNANIIYSDKSSNPNKCDYWLLIDAGV